MDGVGCAGLASCGCAVRSSVVGAKFDAPEAETSACPCVAELDRHMRLVTDFKGTC